MKRADIRQANEILDLYLSCKEKMRAQMDIAVSGPTQETKMLEFQGDFPQLSNVKPDILSVKVEKMRKFYIHRDELNAYQSVMALPKQARPFVTHYAELKHKHNEATKKPYTHKDIARALGRSDGSYERVREHTIMLLIMYFNAKSTKYGTLRLKA